MSYMVRSWIGSDVLVQVSIAQVFLSIFAVSLHISAHRYRQRHHRRLRH